MNSRKLCLTSSLVAVFVSLTSMSAMAQQEQDVWDPIEPVNRGIFWVNDQIDIYLAEPIAREYSENVPDMIKLGIHNFFQNLQYPLSLVNSLLQLRFEKAWEETGRFLLNTTLGWAGLADVASAVNLEQHDQDFGLTFASYGIPSGPYLVLPVFGPSNLRDGIGRIVNGVFVPTYWVGVTSWEEDFQISLVAGTTALELLDTRYQLLDAIEAAKEASLDYYSFAKNSYEQYREGRVRGEKTEDDYLEDVFDDEPY